MGQSTDAILFYGYCWQDDEVGSIFDAMKTPPDPRPDEEDWPELIALREGHKNPWDDFPEELNHASYGPLKAKSDEWISAHRKQIDAWFELKSKIEKRFKVEAHTHCSCDYPILYVCAAQSRLLARRGGPEKVDSLLVGDAWDNQLAVFVKELDLKLPQKAPQWWLVSNWC